MPRPSITNLNLNVNLTALCREGSLKEALHILLTTHNPPVNSSTYHLLLQTCISKKTLSEGKQIHSHINEREFKFATQKFLRNTLIRMYDKCGSLEDVRQLFDQMTEPDVFAWNLIIAAYRRHGCPQEALTLFHQMQRTYMQPDQFTFATILPACAEIKALEQGMDIHQRIIERGFLSDVVVASALVDMYVKCESIHKARQLFDKMPQRDVVSWTSMIAGYAQNGVFDEALRLFKEMPQRNVVSWNAMIAGYAQNGFSGRALEVFKQMQMAGIKPVSTTFVSVLPACAKMGSLEQGMDIHQSIIECGFWSDVVVASALVDMYAKCGSIHKARELFDKMHPRDVVSWTAMIAGYTQNGFVIKALETFKQMQLAGAKPNSTTFASILPACAKMGAVEHGMDIHQSIIERGFLSDVVVANALLDLYAKCGSMHKARELFDKMPERNVVSWNVMIAGYAQNGVLDDALRLFEEMSDIDVVSWTGIIAGYAQNGFNEKALETFKKMLLASVKLDSTTFACILPVCAKMRYLELGMDIHQSIIECGYLSDVIVMNCLIDMYVKCGSTHKARKLFDKMAQRDVVSWNAMIAGYAQNGLIEKAVETFKQMQLSGVKPDSTAFASILPACAKMGALEQGMDIHQSIIESGFLSDVIVASALVDMYAKCGSIPKACKVFDKMCQRDVVSWTAMIAGYAQNGLIQKAMKTFKQLQLTGVQPNSTTFASILPACAKMGSLEQGMSIHQRIIERGFLSDVVVASALVDMYAKCGSIHKARELFEKMPQRNLISWNAMIAGYAQNGFCKDALKLFEMLKHSGTYPDRVSFACVLLACSHAGLMDEGCKYFNVMSESYCIKPTIDHYVGMVDLLGRAGYLEETLNFIIKMPIKPVVVVWMCLLGVCRAHKNIGLGVFTATLVFELDPKNPATYVLLSNIYAEVGKWGEVQIVRRLMKDRGIKKIPGCSWIEGHEMVHAFCVGDRSHPQTRENYA